MPSVYFFIIFIVIILVSIILGYLFYIMNRSSALTSDLVMEEPLIGKMEFKNDYAAVIIKAKLKLDQNLQRYGMRRGINESQRDFNKRVEKFVPGTEKYLEVVRELVQDVIFSTNNPGEAERDRCIMALRNVQFRLEKKILTEKELKDVFEGRTKPYSSLSPDLRKQIVELADKGFYREMIASARLHELYEDGIKTIPGQDIEKDTDKYVYIDKAIRDYFLNIISSFTAMGLLASAPNRKQIGEFIGRVRDVARKAERNYAVPEDITDILEKGNGAPFELNKSLKGNPNIAIKDIIAYAHTDVAVPG